MTRGIAMIKEIEPYKEISTPHDKIRPSYPEKLIQDKISKTELKLSDKLLENGAGRRKATLQFTEKEGLVGVYIRKIAIDCNDN
jgi:hypothetical protein